MADLNLVRRSQGVSPTAHTLAASALVAAVCVQIGGGSIFGGEADERWTMGSCRQPCGRVCMMHDERFEVWRMGDAYVGDERAFVGDLIQCSVFV